MPKPKPVRTEPAPRAVPEVDAAKAARAWEALKSRIEAVPDRDLPAGRVDIGAAALAAYGVGLRVNEPALHARFKSLPKSEFDLRHVTDLPPLALAAWYCANRASGARPSEARVDATLVAKARGIESRMQTLLEYHFADHPVHGETLRRLAPGNDYGDIAGDLLGYAEMYAAEPAIVASDRKNYRATDRADAIECANDIVAQLGAGTSKEQRGWADKALRCFALLLASYGEVSLAGVWLERARKDRHERYPSLYSAARPNVGRPSKKAAGAKAAKPKKGGAAGTGDGASGGGNPGTT